MGARLGAKRSYEKLREDALKDPNGRFWQLLAAAQFRRLAESLAKEKQAEITFDAKEKIQVLNKLGTIYGDRLNNDEGAVNAWRALLTLDPDGPGLLGDRRACLPKLIHDQGGCRAHRYR